MSALPRPVGGRLFTRNFAAFFLLAALGGAMILYRFFAGLGPTTAMSDGFPWGIWKAFAVVTGTALACGGYAMALLCYVLNKGKYHHLVRPAVLASCLGYTVAGFSVLIELGRFWRLPALFYVWEWNFNSVLLEVALCITTYVLVLWVEVAPIVLDRWRREKSSRFHTVAARVAPLLERALPFVLALGILLPTMHQSSLGSMMLIAQTKLHPFWHTPWLPLLFLLSCLAMGYATVVIQSMLGSLFFGNELRTRMLRRIARLMGGVLLAFLLLRLGDLAASGKLAQWQSDKAGWLFLIENALFLASAAIVLLDRRLGAGRLFQAAFLMILAGGFYRFDTYLVAYQPGGGWVYFPTVTEILVVVGMVAAEVVIYVFAVKRFPILAGLRPAPTSP